MFIDLRLGGLHAPLEGTHWSGAEALTRALRRATHLKQLGIGRGDRVFVHYGNRPEFFVDVVAVWLLGACLVPVDPRFTALEVQQLAEAVRPAASIWDGEVPAALSSALKAAGARVLHATEAAPTVDPYVWAAGLPALDDPALLLFTSGTTGQPKGVVHTHRSLRARWNHQHEHLGTEAFARTLCIVPTHFAWGLVGHCLFAWLSGQSLYVAPAFRQDVLLRLGALCDDYEITCLPSVPTMWRVALKTVAPPKRGTLRRVTSGTAPFPVALWRDVQQWAGADEVLNIYGITETGWIAGATTAQLDGRENLVGTPWGALIRVLKTGDPAALNESADDVACAPGEAGHIWVQSPALMHGYFERDDLTRQVMTRGWFSTGDLGYVDERGLLYLKGRHKELINVGGAKIYPGDIDTALGRCDGVLDVCTFGYDDPLQGENVAVAVVLRDADKTGLSRVYRQALDHLASHQLPRRWYIIGEIPRTLRGKLSRSDVAASCASIKPVEQHELARLVAAARGAG